MMKQNLEARTFGKSPAAIKLVEIMNEQEFAGKRVDSILSQFNRTLHELENINDSKIRLGLSKLSFDKYNKRCDNLPSPINTFTCNVLSTNYKVWMEKQNANKPYKTRQKCK